MLRLRFSSLRFFRLASSSSVKVPSIFNSSFDKRCRTAVRKSEKEGVVVELNDDDEHLKAFHILYTDSMDAKEAREFYGLDYLWQEAKKVSWKKEH